jgi:hypothetical protein
MLKVILPALMLLVSPTFSQAQACWVESGPTGQRGVQPAQCAENISLPDMPERLCRGATAADRTRHAPGCPSLAVTHQLSGWAARSVAARCMGMTPPGAQGQVTLVFYQGQAFEQQADSLRALCPAFGGQWQEEAS